MPSNLAVDIAGLQLRNPTILASGVLGISGSTLRHAGDVGAGAVITKSLGLKPRTGYGNPTIVEVEGGLLNAMGLPNPGAEEFVDEIKIAKEGKAPVIASIFGSSLEEFAIVARIVEAGGANAIELNLSCPHVGKVGLQLGQDPALVRDVVRRVKSAVEIPVIAKLSSNVSNIVDVASSAERGGANAVTAINTIRAMAIDVHVKKPILANVIGGLSGPAIKPVAMRCVYEIYESVKIPIIAAGGVKDWEDAVEYFLAGASAVQIGTAIKTYGLEVFSLVTSGIDGYMKANGYKEVLEIVGKAHGS
ncbi:MAG TPA: dihydroorotate dehydrogenase [Candidatus Bathyarchaeia archaeon]|nr:dihydroorotate dehydrogenase [Candidatus Bathyarchaeia archaeon]